jgi:hypothetical protein
MIEPMERNLEPDDNWVTVQEVIKLDTEIEDLKLELKDTIEQFDDIMNKLWQLLYPGKTDWDYPGQVYNHIRIELETLNKKLEDARHTIDNYD